ncbi:MAG: PspC domain-containing protein [Candidatus Latescibacteria bacterium]|nr:PspC domain-containing protein [Candidatus Latescibacterota bacterium]
MFRKTVCLMLISSLLLVSFVGCGKSGVEAKKVMEDGEIVRPLVQIKDQGILLGVCSGMAYKWAIDPWIPRICFLFTIPAGGLGIWAYLLFAMVLDEAPAPDDYDHRGI